MTNCYHLLWFTYFLRLFTKLSKFAVCWVHCFVGISISQDKSYFSFHFEMSSHRPAFPSLLQNIYVLLSKETPMTGFVTTTLLRFRVHVTSSALRLRFPCRLPVVLPSDTPLHTHWLPTSHLLCLHLETLCP